MEQIAFITGADRGLGLSMTAALIDKGWKVFAGSYMPHWIELSELASKHPDNLTIVPLDVSTDQSVLAAAEIVSKSTDRIDLIISNAGVSAAEKDTNIRGSQDYDELQKVYNINAIGPLRVVKALLNFTDKSRMKRICVVSSEAGSINFCHRKAWYGYCMSKAALNMGIKILFNQLRPEGYTFRLYHPGWLRTYMSGIKNNQADMEADQAAKNALAYFLSERFNRHEGGKEQNDEDRLVMRDWKGSEWPW
jgi:NAD(P)-dependent dehydrogenase (short-subunit alcohol dehydrogenase family)